MRTTSGHNRIQSSFQASLKPSDTLFRCKVARTYERTCRSLRLLLPHTSGHQASWLSWGFFFLTSGSVFNIFKDCLNYFPSLMPPSLLSYIRNGARCVGLARSPCQCRAASISCTACTRAALSSDLLFCSSSHTAQSWSSRSTVLNVSARGRETAGPPWTRRLFSVVTCKYLKIYSRRVQSISRYW